MSAVISPKASTSQHGMSSGSGLAPTTTFKQLLTGLRLALGNLKLAGCRQVYIGGSFVTDKERPNDYDKFGGELVPNPAMAGFFQTDKNGNPKGIIVLDPTAIP
jgi:hypothetical protein